MMNHASPNIAHPLHPLNPANPASPTYIGSHSKNKAEEHSDEKQTHAETKQDVTPQVNSGASNYQPDYFVLSVIVMVICTLLGIIIANIIYHFEKKIKKKRR